MTQLGHPEKCGENAKVELSLFQLRMCLSTDFVLHQSVASESLSVDTFSYKNDVYVTIAAPSTDNCMVFQWDHIEMNFRTYDNITGTTTSRRGASEYPG